MVALILGRCRTFQVTRLHVAQYWPTCRYQFQYLPSFERCIADKKNTRIHQAIHQSKLESETTLSTIIKYLRVISYYVLISSVNNGLCGDYNNYDILSLCIRGLFLDSNNDGLLWATFASALCIGVIISDTCTVCLSYLADRSDAPLDSHGRRQWSMLCLESAIISNPHPMNTTTYGMMSQEARSFFGAHKTHPRGAKLAQISPVVTALRRHRHYSGPLSGTRGAFCLFKGN